MAKPLSEEVQKQWKDKIDEQRNSNLSIAAWCRQNGGNVHVFYYWQKKFYPKSPLSRSVFTEIIPKDEPSSGIVLEYQGISIHIHRHFDQLVLKKCLEVLKEC